MEQEADIQYGLINIFDNELSLSPSLQIFEEKLTAYINELISKNFEKLISILYRIDVSEQKLKQELAHASDSNAGAVIARLMIERQVQKIKTRSIYSKERKPGDEEGWL